LVGEDLLDDSDISVDVSRADPAPLQSLGRWRGFTPVILVAGTPAASPPAMLPDPLQDD
jgi:hypothetical protein